MYSREEREWALYVLSEVGSVCEAARVAGVSASTLCRWASAPGAALAGRKEAVYLPNGRKAELAARYEAGERAAALAAEAGVSPSAVRHWARRIREEGALALMTEDDARAAGPAPAEPPSELGALRARCEELELENAILAGTIEILKKDPGADLSALTAAERAALAESLRPRFGLPRVLAALSLPRSTYC